jgi:exopolyphosphatase/pppGpp-phosphohydrolase
MDTVNLLLTSVQPVNNLLHKINQKEELLKASLALLQYGKSGQYNVSNSFCPNGLLSLSFSGGNEKEVTNLEEHFSSDLTHIESFTKTIVHGTAFFVVIADFR